MEVITKYQMQATISAESACTVGILDDLAGVLHATAQRRNTGLKALVDRGQANEFLAEGRGIAQAEQHVVAVIEDAFSSLPTVEQLDLVTKPVEIGRASCRERVYVLV